MLKREISGLGVLEAFLTIILVVMIAGAIAFDGPERWTYAIGAIVMAVAVASCEGQRRRRR